MRILSALWQTAQAIMAITVLILVALSHSAKKNPHIAWLQKFHLPDRRTEEQKRRAQRIGRITDGFEMIIAGVCIPASYLLMTVMFFSEVNPLIFGSLALAGFVLAVLGVVSIVKSRS
jgi:hypothetical protein